MSHDRGDWIPWYCEDSPGWLELSLAARGAAEGIARKMGPRRGVLPLGSRGLRGLAVLLRCPWEQLEPILPELLEGEHPRFTYDAERQCLVDPQHEDRRLRGSADRMRELRARRKGVTGDASDARDVTAEHVTGVTASDACSRLLSSNSDLISSSEADQINPSGGSSGDPPPKWFADLVAAIALKFMVDLNVDACWLRYAGHRESKSEETGRVLKPGPGDARYWVTTVMVPEAQDAIKKANRERERDAKFDAKFKDYRPQYDKPTAGQTSNFQAELQRRLIADAKKGAA